MRREKDRIKVIKKHNTVHRSNEDDALFGGITSRDGISPTCGRLCSKEAGYFDVTCKSLGVKNQTSEAGKCHPRSIQRQPKYSQEWIVTKSPTFSVTANEMLFDMPNKKDSC